MKRIFIQKVFLLLISNALVLLNTIDSLAQLDSLPTDFQKNKWGIGVKLKNPSGITIKRYFGAHALEFNIGKYNTWHQNNQFYLKHSYKNIKEDYYYDHLEVFSRPLSLQLHYMKHNEISKFPGLTYYYGAGAQVRMGTYYYHYYYYEQPDVKMYDKEYRRYFACGVDGLVGLDYTFRSIPFTIFMDVTMYMEAVNNPFFTQLKTSSGLRYNF